MEKLINKIKAILGIITSDCYIVQTKRNGQCYVVYYCKPEEDFKELKEQEID